MSTKLLRHNYSLIPKVEAGNQDWYGAYKVYNVIINVSFSSLMCGHGT